MKFAVESKARSSIAGSPSQNLSQSPPETIPMHLKDLIETD